VARGALHHRHRHRPLPRLHHPTGAQLRNTHDVIGWKIDIRSPGGYVVAGSPVPPSGYELIDKREPAVGDFEFAVRVLIAPAAWPQIPFAPASARCGNLQAKRPECLYRRRLLCPCPIYEYVAVTAAVVRLFACTWPTHHSPPAIPSPRTSVTVSTTRSILWDQITYAWRPGRVRVSCGRPMAYPRNARSAGETQEPKVKPFTLDPSGPPRTDPAAIAITA
jgi:hypothetical protein